MMFGRLTHDLLPGLAPQPVAFAIAGMAAFFTAVVRAPLTGIVLIAEMTSTTTLMVPMLAACFAATLTATLLGSDPVYDTLRKRMLRVRRPYRRGELAPRGTDPCRDTTDERRFAAGRFRS